VLRAAVAAAAEHPRLQVLALTVITSLTDRDLPEIGLAPSVKQQVERLARLAAGAGCHGIVASAQEAAYLRTQLPPGMAIVTPGIQLPGAGGNDQARVATVDFARRAGATPCGHRPLHHASRVAAAGLRVRGRQHGGR
jgi:orotidine-5'-phosphate decarboxylase